VNQVFAYRSQPVLPLSNQTAKVCLQMFFKVWSADPLGVARLFLSFYLEFEGEKVLNTFKFYKIVSSGRLVQHTVHSAQENILLWILANHSFNNLEAGEHCQYNY
jgi:hypothetical protein